VSRPSGKDDVGIPPEMQIRVFAAKSSEDKLPTSAGKSVFGPVLTFLRRISFLLVYKSNGKYIIISMDDLKY
jgi:hypothetical protein